MGTAEQAQVPTIYRSKAHARPSENAGFIATACGATPKAVSGSARACCEPAERNGVKTGRAARNVAENYRQYCLPWLLCGLMDVFAGEISNKKFDVCILKSDAEFRVQTEKSG